MKNYTNQFQKIALAVIFSLLSFGSAFAQAETAKIKDGTISNGATKAKDGAIFELESNNKGMLISRMSTAQRNAIPASNLSNGLLVFNTNTNCFDYWDSLRTQWLSMCGTPPPAVFDVTAAQCSAITVNGSYKQGVTLLADNTLVVPVTVTQAGTYTMTATTANGYYFEASGSFPNAGTYDITLKGTGRPSSGYVTGDPGDTVSLILNGVVCSCVPHIFVEKASVDFTVTCAAISAVGTYNVGLNLDGNVNKLKVDVNVTNLGFWSMKTNTINGYSFTGQGTFTATGLQTVELLGTGMPIASGTDIFSLSSNANSQATASCSGIPVTVATVAYTMNCAGATQSGTYMQNVALNSTSNTITLPVNVTATGNTTISTNTVNGVSFSSGPIALTALGVQNVVLKGSGTPLTGNTTNLIITGTPGASATCAFNLVIAQQPIAYTMTCGGISVAGSYAPGVAMNAATNTMTIPVTVTYVGDWNITTNTVNGVTFSGSGTFTTTGGGQSVTLHASGTAVTGGNYSYTITTNSTVGGSCTKSITYIFPTTNILGLGSNAAYYPGASSSSYTIKALLSSTANFGASGTVASDPFNFIDGRTTEAAALKTLINTNKIDVIIIGFNFSPNAASNLVLQDFVVNKKGVLIQVQESDAAGATNLINAISGGSVTVNGTAVTHINPIANLNGDPIINGPFGNLAGKILGADVGTSHYNVSNVPSNMTVLSTSNTDASKAFVIKHNTLGYVFCGDGGLLGGNSSNTSTDYYPAKISATGLPMTKAYVPAGINVDNSTFYANMMAWAVKYVQDNTVKTYVLP